MLVSGGVAEATSTTGSSQYGGAALLPGASATSPNTSPYSSPGRYIGPTHASSVSFVVLLRSSTAPTCLQHWAGASGLSLSWEAGQQWATINGTPRNVDRSFGVSINNYRAPNGSVVFAADRPANVPSGVCNEIAAVGTIHSFVKPTALDVPQGGLTQVDLMRAYDALPLEEQGYYGQGHTVVFIEVDGFSMSDLNKFASDMKLPAYNMTLVGKNPGKGDETPMDLETVHEIAPDAHLVFLNLLDVNASVASAYAQTITQSAKHWPGAVFSISLGLCEIDAQAYNQADLEALNDAIASVEAKGSTVFASSGDSGGLDCTPSGDAGDPPQSGFVGVSAPAVLPAVTGTGGTSLTTDSEGNYVSEATWSEPLLAQGGGGGISKVFRRPSWQTGDGTGGQIDTNDGREVPDVSADSDPNTGNFIIESGNAETGGGTSLASPIWAGMTTLMDQYLQAHHDRPVGFFNPILYHLASSHEAYPPFHDVTLGGNDFYLATPGYDPVTGLGSPDVWNLARDLKAGRY
jgi:kumamolisin